MELAENEEPEGHAKAVPTPHPCWGFICSDGWPRLQEGRGFMSIVRGMERSQRREGRPRAVLGLVGVGVGQNFCGPCSSRAS